MSHDPAKYRELVEPLTTAVSRLASGALLEIAGDNVPGVDSVAMAQLSNEDRIVGHPLIATPITDAISSTSQYIGAGADHVRTMCTAYDSEPPVVYSDRVLLRAAIEACARSAWLSDRVDAAERARRVINERLASITDQIEVAKASGEGLEEVLQILRERRDEITRISVSAGLGEAKRRNGRVSIGRIRPGPTAVIKWFGEKLGSTDTDADVGRMLQAMYSGFTHSSLWALGSAIASDIDNRDGLLPGTGVAPLVAKAEIAVRCLGVAAAAIVGAVDSRIEFMDSDNGQWVEVRASAAQALDRYRLDD